MATPKKPLAVKMVNVSDLIPYARNARTHSDEQVTMIAGSIKEFGFNNPVLVDGALGIVAGHGRVLAARKLGMISVPTIELSHLSDTQKRAYILADNKLAERAGWDTEMLKLELADLGPDALADIGFSADELQKIKGVTEGKTDADDVPPAPETPVSRLGDLWTLGAHRLLCGDSTKAEDVERVMGEKKADACITDPPYGLGDTTSEKNNYDTYDDTVDNLTRLIAVFLPLAKSTATRVVLTPGNLNQRRYPAPDWTMAWFVPAGTGRGPWGFCCWQPILCYGKDPKLAHGLGSFPDAIVHTERAEESIHPCSKPVGFWSWLLERASIEGAVLFEPFSGSGTTIIAAEKTGRTVSAIELSPTYVDVAVLRWQAFTGKTATLNGKTFDEVAKERRAR